MAQKLLSARLRGLGSPPRVFGLPAVRQQHRQKIDDSYVDLRVTTLLDHERRAIVRNYRFTAAAGDICVLTHHDPAARWTLAHLLAGRLRSDRYTFHGELRVADRRTTSGVRAVVGLAEPWQIRSTDDEVDRRLRALDWAESTGAPVVVLSPGFDGLEPPQFPSLVDRARRLSAQGTTVIITGPPTVDLHALGAKSELGNIAHKPL